jgi:hypothetical protein
MGGRIEVVKTAVKKIIRSLGSGVYVTILLFDSYSRQLFPPQVITGNNLCAILQLIDSIRTGSSTNLIGALDAGTKIAQNFEEFMGDVAFTQECIILTDGEPDNMPSINHIPRNVNFWIMTFGGGVNANNLLDIFIQAAGLARVKYSTCNTNCQIEASLSEFAPRVVWASSVTITVPEGMEILMSAASDNGRTYAIPDVAYEDVAAIPIRISSDISSEEVASLVQIVAVINEAESQIPIRACENQSIIDAALEKKLMRRLVDIDSVTELEVLREEISKPKYSNYPCIPKILELIGTRYNLLSSRNSANNESQNTMTQIRMTSETSHMSRHVSQGLRQASRQVTIATSTDATSADASTDETADATADAMDASNNV